MTPAAALTAKLLDGTLSAAEEADLAALVAGDPAAAAEHLALLELEAELRAQFAELDVAEATVAAIGDALADRAAAGVLARLGELPPPGWAPTPAPAPAAREPFWKRRRAALVAATAACAAAVVVGAWAANRPAAPPSDVPAGAPVGELVQAGPRPFARLSRKAGSVEVLAPGGEAFPADEGAELPAGFTLRTGDDGLATVDLLGDPARFDIESGTVVRFGGAERLYLAAGQLTATVPDRAADRPFVVGTGAADVFARGGLFVVSSAAPDTARIDIRRGAVELVRAATPKPVPLTAGAAFVTAGHEPMHTEAARAVDREPLRVLPFVGARDAVFSPDGAEVWVGNARQFTRWAAGGPADLTFFGRSGEGVAAGFSRDRRHLLTFRGDRDDRVLIRTLPDGGEHAAVALRPNEPRHWALAPDASWVAVAEPRPHNRVTVRSADTDEERFTHRCEDTVGCVAAGPDGRVLAVGLSDLGRGTNNKVVLLDARTGARLGTLPTQRKALTALAYSDDGAHLAVGFNGAIQLWDVRTRELLRTITGFERCVSCLAFDPGAKLLAAGTYDGHVWVWDADTLAQTQLIAAGGRGVRSVAFAPDGRQLVTTANGSPVCVWAVRPPGGL